MYYFLLIIIYTFLTGHVKPIYSPLKWIKHQDASGMKSNASGHDCTTTLYLDGITDSLSHCVTHLHIASPSKFKMGP
jgi:hypothetical protein